MSKRGNQIKYPAQTKLLGDKDPPIELSRLPNDADDTSEAGRPATDHDEKGWRAASPVKP